VTTKPIGACFNVRPNTQVRRLTGVASTNVVGVEVRNETCLALAIFVAPTTLTS
jgi:hypothetical protein